MKPIKQLLFLCGIISSVLYISADVISAGRWENYNFSSQTISELMATNAVSRPVAVPLFIFYDILVIAFGSGILLLIRQKRLRFAGGLIIGIGITGLITTLFFPMHLRGNLPTINDSMHIILTGITTVLIMFTIGLGSAVYGKSFRYYSVFTILILLVFGILAGMDGKNLAEQQPTPWLGITERITIGAYLLWMAVLSVILLRKSSPASLISYRSPEVN